MTDAELRELDAEIHRKVFGAHCERGAAFGGAPVDWITQREWGTDYVPNYSTEIAAAWLVVERAAPPGTIVAVLRQPDGNWGVRIAGVVYPSAPTPMLAICRAALKAVDDTDGGRDADSYKLNPGGQRA